MAEKSKKLALLLLALCFCLTALGASGWDDGWDNDWDNNWDSGSSESSGGDNVWSGSTQTGTPINRALATLNQEPVALLEVSQTLVTTSATGCMVSSVTWYDSNWNIILGAFDTSTVHLQVRLDALYGYYFPDAVEGYINNNACSITRDPSGSFVTLSKDYAPGVWAPVVTNHPKAAKVDPGEYVDFWVSGAYTEDYEWSMLDPSGKKVSLEDAQKTFSSASFGGNFRTTLIINNVPAEMNGWSVVCTLLSAGRISRVSSNAAKITVNVPVTPEPTPSPTPTPEPSPLPSAAPGEDAETDGFGEDHEHEFSTIWSSDESFHWRECVCGERTDEGEHEFKWTELRAATKRKAGEEQGVCALCGYTMNRPTSYDSSRSNGGLSGLKIGLIVAGIAAVVGLVVFIVSSIQEARRRRRRRRRRRGGGHSR